MEFALGVLTGVLGTLGAVTRMQRQCAHPECPMQGGSGTMQPVETQHSDTEPSWYVRSGDQPTDATDLLRRAGITPEDLDRILANQRRRHRQEADAERLGQQNDLYRLPTQ